MGLFNKTWDKWIKSKGGFKSRYSKDGQWIEIRCPKKHIGTWRTTNNTKQMQRWLNRHMMCGK